jgi:radical SAM protein with 4Fe4S-binding SPASM domain
MKPYSALFNTTFKHNIPLLCTFEITRRCNLSCRHCYLDFKPAKDSLTTKQIKNILLKLKSAGVLYLVFTGGEPFIRKDILELSRYARKLKFDLRIFTNGILVTEKDAAFLSSVNISGIEISLYGNRQTHDKITNSKGSFDKVIETIKILKKHKIPVTIKCPMMKTNYKDYLWLKDFANKLKVKLKIDPAIGPKNNGDRSILKYRLSDQQLTKIYSSFLSYSGLTRISSKLSSLNNGFPITTFGNDKAKNNDSLFCSAGHNLLAIDYKGNIYPCLQLPKIMGNLNNISFNSIWNNKTMEDFRKITAEEIHTCFSCGIKQACQRCPGLALVEDGNLYGPSKIACQIANIAKVTKNT